MWKFIGDIDFVCDNCKSQYTVSIDDFDIEISGGNERSMGAEYLHDLTYEVSCDECHQDIVVKFEVSEYPLGAINIVIDRSDGAEALSEPSIDYFRDEFEEELFWVIGAKAKDLIFSNHIKSVKNLLSLVDSVNVETKFSLLVMLHGHIVAAVEGYLAGTFIQKVTNSEELIKKLIESDPEFSKRKFTLKEIYIKQSTLKLTVATYLNDLIFHKIEKINHLYRNVLGHDFGDIQWLFNAISIRHHCVHRAGYDKDGNAVEISRESILDLLEKAESLLNSVEATLLTLAEAQAKAKDEAKLLVDDYDDVPF